MFLCSQAKPQYGHEKVPPTGMAVSEYGRTTLLGHGNMYGVRRNGKAWTSSTRPHATAVFVVLHGENTCLLYTSPSPRDS